MVQGAKKIAHSFHLLILNFCIQETEKSELVSIVLKSVIRCSDALLTLQKFSDHTGLAAH